MVGPFTHLFVCGGCASHLREAQTGPHPGALRAGPQPRLLYSRSSDALFSRTLLQARDARVCQELLRGFYWRHCTAPALGSRAIWRAKFVWLQVE